jgi:hypothetical protein
MASSQTHVANMKKHWKCATSNQWTDVYITTSDSGDVADRTEIEIAEAHIREAREAFFYYSLPRGIVLTDSLREVSAVPRVKTEVTSGYAFGPEPHPFSISATVYEVSVDAQGEEGTQPEHPEKHGCEDGLDPERREALAYAKMHLLEVIYSLEGLLDENNEQYDDLPACLRESEDPQLYPIQRWVIESAIRLLYDGHHALENGIPHANS